MLLVIVLQLHPQGYKKKTKVLAFGIDKDTYAVEEKKEDACPLHCRLKFQYRHDEVMSATRTSY